MRSNTILAVIFLGGSVLFPVLTAIILYACQHRLEEDKFKHSIEAMYENIDVERKSALAYTIVFLTRRLLFSAVLVWMINYPLYQVFCTYFLCFFNTLYIIAVKPFKTPTSNFSEIFNEICLLFGAVHLFLYTSYLQGQVTIQYNSGWSMIALTGLNIIVNVSLMVVSSVRMVKMLFLKTRWRYRNWQHQRKLKRAEKYYMEGEFNEELKQDKFRDKVYQNLKKYKPDEFEAVANSSNGLDQSKFNLMFAMPNNSTNDAFDQTPQTGKNGVVQQVFNFYQRKKRKYYSRKATKSPMNTNQSSIKTTVLEPTQQFEVAQSIEINDVGGQYNMVGQGPDSLNQTRNGYEDFDKLPTSLFCQKSQVSPVSPSKYSPSMGSPVARHNFNNQKFEAQFRINEVPQASRNNKFTFRDVMVNLYKENGGNDSDY